MYFRNHLKISCLIWRSLVMALKWTAIRNYLLFSKEVSTSVMRKYLSFHALSSENILLKVFLVWADNGDECSRQYAGTGALKVRWSLIEWKRNSIFHQFVFGIELNITIWILTMTYNFSNSVQCSKSYLRHCCILNVLYLTYVSGSDCDINCRTILCNPHHQLISGNVSFYFIIGWLYAFW